MLPRARRRERLLGARRGLLPVAGDRARSPPRAVHLVLGSPDDERARKAMKRILSGPMLPGNMVYLVALRKETDAGFRAPLDIA